MDVATQLEEARPEAENDYRALQGQPPDPVPFGWRVAGCLDQLLREINASAPDRSTASDGSIGDAAHQGTDSDHNPWCQGWVVTARDFTHDPGDGFDSYAFADWLRRRCKGEILIDGKRETRVKYIISNRRIASPTDNWAWRDYTGSNPHDKHVHVSVDCTAEGGGMDSTQPWGWSGEANDVSAGEVWTYDVDPSSGTYSASGALWTVYNRTGYLANEFAPMVLQRIDALEDEAKRSAATRRELSETRLALYRQGTILLGLLVLLVVVAVAVGASLLV